MSCSWNFETVPLKDLGRHDQLVFDTAESLKNHSRRLWLPAYDDARMLFDRYAKYVCHFHHIIHLPTLRKTLENVYLKLSRKELVDTDHIALLFSIFATVICYTKWSNTDPVPLESSMQDDCFLLLFRSALDMLDHSRRVLPSSLEIVQTCIILVFLDYNLEGFTSRARAVLIQALHSAKELSMHKLDSPALARRRDESISIDSLIETEMKRRIWWHLVSTDWMVSLAGSAQEGTYNCNPQQMRVRLPRNIDDEVLDRGNTTEDLPLTHPTAMCYPLHRVRLGEISRSIVDTLRFGLVDPTEHDYTQVMLIDKRIENFLEDLPVFLKIDSDSIQKSQYILERYPYFAIQRYIVNIGGHSIRCKLHQPFLVKSNGKERYAQSVETCLASALTVIEINKAIRTDPTHYIPEKVKLIGLLHHMFLATIVLVMDMCFNRVSGTEDVRGAEILNAIKMLEEAKEESASAQKFLESLTEALRKHQIRFKDDLKTQTCENGDGASAQQSATRSWLAIATGQDPNQEVCEAKMYNASQTATVGFEDVWRDTVFNGEIANMPDWDQLFSELDAFIA